MRSRRSLLFWLVAIAVGAIVVQVARDFAPWLERNPPWVATPSGATVSGRARVIDGDSIEVAGARIRLFGIDAPEGRQECRDGADHVYSCGREAARALAAFIAGRTVTCTAVEHDRYNRNVSICTVDAIDLGEAMVRSGHALDYLQHSRGRYAAAEREARQARRGLWAGSFDSPSAWRRIHGEMLDANDGASP